MQISKHQNSQLLPQNIIPVNPNYLLESPSIKISKTKKICTLGPKSSSVQAVIKLIDNGLNVARLNFSHGSHQGHKKYIHVVKEALKHRPDRHVAILLDTKGPQIRTGKNEDGVDIILQKGQQLAITPDYSVLCTSSKISCSYKDLLSSVKIGSTILFADGKISSIVKKIDQENNLVIVEVLNNGTMGEKKNMCLPGCQITLPTINDYDENDIVNFGVKHKVDFIAVSFARFKKDIQYIRQIIAQKDPQYAKKVQIISKIQNHQAFTNIDEIIDASNGIMIARGDLGMETPLQKIILLQKLITTKCLEKGKYVIVATQMLQSMQSKPRPTRAQVSDITNAVLDLADSIMTSGQTTNGQFIQETVSYMNKISIETQRICNYRKLFGYRKNVDNSSISLEAIKIVKKSFQNDAQIIFLKTNDIGLVNRVSSLRPKAYIFVFTNSNELRSYTSLNYGVYCFKEGLYQIAQEFLISIKNIFGFKSPINVLFSYWDQKLSRFHSKFQLYFKQK